MPLSLSVVWAVSSYVLNWFYRHLGFPLQQDSAPASFLEESSSNKNRLMGCAKSAFFMTSIAKSTEFKDGVSLV